MFNGIAACMQAIEEAICPTWLNIIIWSELSKASVRGRRFEMKNSEKRKRIRRFCFLSVRAKCITWVFSVLCPLACRAAVAAGTAEAG